MGEGSAAVGGANAGMCQPVKNSQTVGGQGGELALTEEESETAEADDASAGRNEINEGYEPVPLLAHLPPTPPEFDAFIRRVLLEELGVGSCRAVTKTIASPWTTLPGTSGGRFVLRSTAGIAVRPRPLGLVLRFGVDGARVR